MSSDYIPTVVQSRPPTESTPSGSESRITLNFIHGSLAGTSQTFTSPVVTFGRGQDNDLKFDPTRDTKVSTHHGRLTLDSATGQWHVEDLGSTNGTFIDGARLDAPAPLASGMTIVLGDATEAGGVIFTVEVNRSGDLFAAAPTGAFSAGGAVSSGTAVQPPAPPVVPPSGEPEESGGFFGKMKGKFNRYMEQRKLSGHLKTLQQQLAQVKQQNLAAYAALGRELVEGDKIDHESLVSLPATKTVRDLQGRIAASEEKIAGIEKEISADEAAFTDWLATFGSSFSQLESAHGTASSELEFAKAAFAQAESSLNEVLKPRLDAVDQATTKLTALASEIRSAPQNATNDQLASIAQTLKDALAQADSPIDALPQATATHASTKQTLADADAKFADLSKQLEAERARKAQRQSEQDALVAGKKQAIAAEQQTIAGLRQQIEQQHPAIGEAAALAAAAGGLDASSLQQHAGANAALNAAKAVEIEIEKTNQRLAELAK
ncbi:MAG: FHA domain-containing protein [Tepidisphaeraceae bacterium]